ncbi:MAG: hypothetical protein M3P85_07725 [Actinomycetota bacterium]|nr:hypothetical protein [Actinomycetota bacterium]
MLDELDDRRQNAVERLFCQHDPRQLRQHVACQRILDEELVMGPFLESVHLSTHTPP